MSKYFGKHHLHGDIKAMPGIDFTSVDIPFVPDYIKVEFHGASTNDDMVYWNLIRADEGYVLELGWSVFEERHLHYRIAKLNVDPV